MTATKLAAGVVLAAGLVLSAGCSDGPTGAAFRDPAVPAGSFQLVSFTSCNEALDRLKDAAKQYVGPWGIGSRQDFRAGGGVAQAEDAAAAPAAPDRCPPRYVARLRPEPEPAQLRRPSQAPLSKLRLGTLTVLDTLAA